MVNRMMRRAAAPHKAQRFQIAIPLATHWEAADCADVDCSQYLMGWETIVPATSPLLEDLRTFLKRGFPDGLRRHGHEEPSGDPGLVKFIFPPGQPCFRATTHKAQNGRPPIWIHNRPEERRILRPDQFKETMNEEAYKITHERAKG